jgi:mRNA interferase RelE/StbE
MKVEIEQQVLDFAGSLAPEPRRLVRNALRRLAEGKGDVRPLEGALEGFYRLRAGRYRIILAYQRTRRTQAIRCIYAGHRSLIYEVFAQEFHDLLER